MIGLIGLYNEWQIPKSENQLEFNIAASYIQIHSESDTDLQLIFDCVCFHSYAFIWEFNKYLLWFMHCSLFDNVLYL